MKKKPLLSGLALPHSIAETAKPSNAGRAPDEGSETGGGGWLAARRTSASDPIFRPQKLVFCHGTDAVERPDVAR